MDYNASGMRCYEAYQLYGQAVMLDNRSNRRKNREICTFFIEIYTFRLRAILQTNTR